MKRFFGVDVENVLFIPWELEEWTLMLVFHAIFRGFLSGKVYRRRQTVPWRDVPRSIRTLEAFVHRLRLASPDNRRLCWLKAGVAFEILQGIQ